MRNNFQLTIGATLCVFTLGIAAERGQAAALSEPPTVLYGKVIQLGQGAAYQLYGGTLTLTIVNQSNPSNHIVKQVQLRPTGAASEFSYRVELPQKYLPSSAELSENLSVGFNPLSYRFESIDVNGSPASPLDSAQSVFSTSFANRAGQHRLDLLVSLVEDDTDGDGIPDWWEDLNGLNRLGPTDALLDNDGDGLTNLEEFKRGTDPNESNTTPLLRTATVVVPVGGVAGLGLVIVDADTQPGSLLLSIGASLPSLSVKRGTDPIPPGNTFTYAEVLAGAITLQSESDFTGGSLQLTIQDLGPGNAQVIADLDVDIFSPMAQLGKRPAVWLDGRFVSGSPVDEWPDLSGNNRDGYQPYPAFRPNAQPQAVDFGGTGFLYLDERGLRFTQFTAFATFDAAAIGPDDETLISSSDLQLKVRGSLNTTQAQAVVIRQAGRSIDGPVVGAGSASQLTLVSGPLHSFLNVGGQTYVQGHAATNVLPAAFAILGGAQSLIQLTAEQLFGGRLKELVIYDQPLTPGDRTRNEDYQRSRWGDLVVWDGRRETTPLLLHGDPARPNALNGGWGEDVLTGGPLPDVLRGGPGADVLTGGPGPDIFQFQKEGATNLVTDYSTADFDVIDLSDIFGDQTGDPASFLAFHNEVIRDENNIPRVYTLLDLNYDGQGSEVDQTIELANTALSAADLPMLLKYGLIRMGGPAYGEVVYQPSFAEWLAIEYPGQDPTGLASIDTDVDGLQTIFEYLYGTNPHEFNARGDVPLSILVREGHIEIEVETREGYSGVNLGLAASSDLSVWTDANGQFDLESQPIGGGRVRHVFRSTQPLSAGLASEFFRLVATESFIAP